MTDGDEGGQQQAVEMRQELWDVVIHSLEENMAQLEPQESNWVGKYPGEDSVELYEEAHNEIARSLNND